MFALVKSVSFNRERAEKYHPRLIQNIITHCEVQLELCSLAHAPGINEEDLRRNWLSTSSISIDTTRRSFVPCC